MPSTCPEGDDVNVNFFLMDFKEGIYFLRKKKMKNLWETVWRGNEFNGCFIDVFLLGYWNIFMGYVILSAQKVSTV